MKTLLISALTALAAVFQIHAASKGATEDWVRAYVATNGGEYSSGTIVETVTNGWITLRGYGTDTNDWVEIKAEYPDKLALVTSNVTAAAIASGVTNGMVFAWNGRGEFWNAPAGIFVSCISNECFSFSGEKSHVTNGVDRFDGLFDVRGTKIPWSMSNALIPVETTSTGWSLLDFLIPHARAEPWKDVTWYTPAEQTGIDCGQYEWEVNGSNGVTANLTYDADGNCNNFESVIGELKHSVNSIFNSMVGLSESLVKAMRDIQIHDRQLKEIADNLNKYFAEAWKRMNYIEDQLDSPTDDGETSKATVNRTIIQKTQEKIVISGGMSALKVDGVSIGVKDENTKDAAYQMKNFPGAMSVNVGLFPVIGNLSGRIGQLMWFDPWNYLDGTTIKIDRSDSYSHLPTKENGKHGIHFAGWYSPESSPHKCVETIADNLTNTVGSTSHYVLTRHGEGNDASVHYMRIGSLAKIAGGGSALRVVGTEGDVTVGSGATTNTIKFVSSPGTKIIVTGSEVANGIDVTIPVGWLWEDQQ